MKLERELELARERLSLARVLHQRRMINPAEWYQPGKPGDLSVDGRILGRYAGQEAFHRATHTFRLLAPGNGWGKSTAAGAEVHAWATHSNQWQRTPAWPLLIVWFVRLRDQFELMRVQLTETIIGASATWANGRFTWPDGSQMFLASANSRTDWGKWQGAPVDLVVFDEQPRQSVFREMSMRARAKRKTRYVIGATATEGQSWMEKELYQPWLRFHQNLGMDEDRALEAQMHPTIFCWGKGGAADNPAVDARDLAHYDEVTSKMHPNERKVRLRGGFASWVGDGVFAAEALAWLEERMIALDLEHGPGWVGMLEPAPSR